MSGLTGLEKEMLEALLMARIAVLAAKDPKAQESIRKAMVTVDAVIACAQAKASKPECSCEFAHGDACLEFVPDVDDDNSVECAVCNHDSACHSSAVEG